MSKPFESPSWYRVAGLRPRLRSHAKIHRQVFRGERWYVLQDHATGRFHRFTPAAHLVISLMDGRRTVQEIWDAACGEFDDDSFGQDDVIRLLSQLYRSDVLHGDVPPDLAEMTERATQMRRRRRIMSVLNPIAIRVPLFDPERIVSATFPLVRPLFTWFGAALFLGVILTGMVLAGVHWSALTENIVDRVLATDSIALLLITYPLVKAVHEFGHAYAVKNWGGEVHEMGVMFLVLMPVPYVDASAAAAFREKSRRALVGAAGIIVEMFLAALALFLWLHVEEGLIRAAAFNVMLIGGVSTLLFNGNPLLRFDGYYVLSDLVEIPNLYQRANRYLGYLIQRYPFGMTDAVSPATAPGEAAWFAGYGIAAFIYRLFIMFAIILFIASKFFIVGVLLAIWSCILMYGVPLAKGLRYLLTSPALRRQRLRAVAATAGMLSAVAMILLAVPVPYATVSEGVVWIPDDAIVRARTDGFVAEVLAAPNAAVERGQPLARLEDPFLAARVKVLEAEVREFAYRYDAARVTDRSEAIIVGERLRHARAELALNRQRAGDLTVRSPIAGAFVLMHAADLPGRFVHKGETLGYVADAARPVIRVVVGQDAIDLVRRRTRAVDVRLSQRLSEVLPARIEREIPSVTNRLPSLALSTMGGGRIAIDPRDPSGTKALEKIYELELRLSRAPQFSAVGARVHVRFDHGMEALAWRLYRNVRQLFLKQFNV